MSEINTAVETEEETEAYLNEEEEATLVVEEGSEEAVPEEEAGKIAAEDGAASASQEAGEGDAGEQLSEEELDSVADNAIDVLREILSYFDAEEAAIDEYEGDEGEIVLDIVGDNLAILIGRHGRTLDSIQLLVSSMLFKRLGFRYPVVIDVGGYKYRRRQKIEDAARRAASKALSQNNSVRMRPMTPYERRLVHIALRDNMAVTTTSEGSEPNRYVVVRPV